MSFNNTFKSAGNWLKGDGPDNDIVISSRVRLARNLENMTFCHWANSTKRKKVLDMCRKALADSVYFKQSLFIDLSSATDVELKFLIERHLISPEQAAESDFKGLSVDKDEIMSVMINEEDHLRIQVMQPGFNLTEAWRIAHKADQDLEKEVRYAVSPRLGYLTSCPTNVGTGMRASVMLHLPALVMSGQIQKALEAITKLGMAVRGVHGEGSKAAGNFFQISNQVTLGRSEEDLIDNLEKIILRFIDKEKNMRDHLYNKNRDEFSDRICRSLGILQTARIINTDEAIKLLSAVRLGIDMEIIQGINQSVINELFITTQPGHLQKQSGKVLSADERDVVRADFIREKLQKLK